MVRQAINQLLCRRHISWRAWGEETGEGAVFPGRLLEEREKTNNHVERMNHKLRFD